MRAALGSGPGNPGPWEWRRRGNGLFLVDGIGLVMLSIELQENWVPSFTPGAQALIAAAPEMEALLRELFPYFDPLPEDIDPGLGLLLTKMLMLVKRIDAAKAGE